jgi:hypothetical protein
VRFPGQPVLEPWRKWDSLEGLLSREGDPIPWVVQADGEEGCGLGIVVGDC